MIPGGVLFDMDGVLVRTAEIWLRLLEEAGRRFRGSPVTREEFEPTFGQGTAADVRVFGFQCTPAELDRYYVENFASHVGGVWVDPEARPTLEALAGQGVKLALVTNTITPLAEEILGAAKLRDLFGFVACADLVPRAKPAPDMVELALEKLGLVPHDAWYVGDSRFDQQAAAGAGVLYVGLRMAGDRRIERLSDLIALLA